MNRRVCLLIPDAGPLISLGRGGALDILLKLELPIYIVDQVKYEVTRNHRFPDALAVEGFIEDNTSRVQLFPTSVGQMAAKARETGFKGRQRGLGEAAIAEFLARLDEVIDIEVDSALLLFEDGDIMRLAFTVPRNVHVVSTLALLEGLEQRGLIASAAEIFDRIKRAGRDPSHDSTDEPGEVAGKPTKW